MHNFKKVLKTFLVLVVCVALLAALDLALYPCTFMRNDVHAVVTQQFDDIIVGTSHGKSTVRKLHFAIEFQKYSTFAFENGNS